MRCPVCSTSLSTGTHEGYELAGCATCGGRFVSFDTLRGVTSDSSRPRSSQEHAEAMASAGTAATVAEDDREPLPCPACGDPMRRYVHQYASGVWVDSCEVHGIWLDAGELEQLEAYAEAAAAGMSPTDTTRVGTAEVGLDQPRVVTTEDAWDHLAPVGPAQSIGSDLDGFTPGVFGMLGQLVDGAISWRRLGRSSASRREQDLVDRTRAEHPDV